MEEHIIEGININEYELRHIRALLKLSQSDLAKLLFVSVRTVQNWEYRKCCPMGVYSLLWRYYFNQKELSGYKEQVSGQIELKQYDLSEYYISVYYCRGTSVLDIPVVKDTFTYIIDYISQYWEIVKDDYTTFITYNFINDYGELVYIGKQISDKGG